MKSESQTYPDLCICCGTPVPEGRMICYACEMGDRIPAFNRPEHSAQDGKKRFGRKKEKRNEPRD